MPQSTEILAIRALIADPGDPLHNEVTLLSDEQLQAFLDLEDNSIRRAAADALEAIAISEVLVSKKITTQDLSTDGPAVAKALMDLAGKYREQELADGDGYFEIIPPANCTWSCL